MKIAVISNIERAREIVDACLQSNTIPFVFSHADPERSLSLDKFLYVFSDDEIVEKINLLKADFTLQTQLQFS